MSTSLFAHSGTVARSASPTAPTSLPAAFAEQLDALAGLVAQSPNLNSAALGPFVYGGRRFPLPRFVYFGPENTDDSPRLAFLAGFDHRDLRGTHALLHFVRRLALQPNLGHGLYLSVFPLIDVLGLAGQATDRRLVESDWRYPAAPELDLLGKDARLHGYHGFVRIATTAEDVLTVQLRGLEPRPGTAPGVELISSQEFTPFPVRWLGAPTGAPADGPLTLREDLPLRAFELTLAVPTDWSAELFREATATVLKRFVLRYRGFLAEGLHL